MSSKNYANDYGHNLDLLIISLQLHVSCPSRSGYREKSIRTTHVYVTKDREPQTVLRYADVIWLLFWTLYLMGVWFHEDQRPDTKKDTCLKEIGLHLHILLTTPVNTIGRPTYSVKKAPNMHFQ